MKQFFYKISILVLFLSGYAWGTINTQQLHRFLWANYLQYKGRSSQAQQWYQKTFEHKAPIDVYNGYIPFLFETGQFSKIVSLIPKLDQKFAEDPQIQRIFALALEKTGKQEEAADRFIKLSKKFITNQEIVFRTAQLFIQRQQLDKALELIESYLNNAQRKPNNFIFHFLKAQLHLHLKQIKKAHESIKRSLELYPQYDKSWLLYAMIEEQLGNLENAIKGYTSFLERTQSPSAQIQNHLLELVFRQKMATQNKQSMSVNRSCFNQALLLLQQKQYGKALKHIDHCLEEKPESDEKKLLKIQILSSMGKPVHAAHQLQAWIEQNPTKELWFKTLHLLCQQGLSYKAALSTLHALEKKQPDNLLPLLYQADMYLRIGNTHHAQHYLHKAYAQTNDEKLKTKLLFQLGRIYYEKRNYKKMKILLEKEHAAKKDFPPLLNLLAYYYATQEKQFDTAQKLIDKALKQDKYNPHFLDTQAIIFYKQGDYGKALHILKKIASTNRDDFSIVKHLGKALHKVGQRKKADKVMQHARLLAQTTYEKNEIQKLLISWRK